MKKKPSKIDIKMANLSHCVADLVMENEELSKRLVAYAEKLFAAGKLPGITKNSTRGEISDVLVQVDGPIDVAKISGGVSLKVENKRWKAKISWQAPWIDAENPLFIEITDKDVSDDFAADLSSIKNESRMDIMKFIIGSICFALVSAVYKAVHQDDKPEANQKEDPVVVTLSNDELQFKTILDALHVESLEELTAMVKSEMVQEDLWDPNADDYVYEIPMVIRFEGTKKDGLTSVELSRMPEDDVEDVDDDWCCPVCGTPWYEDCDDDWDDYGDDCDDDDDWDDDDDGESDDDEQHRPYL